MSFFFIGKGPTLRNVTFHIPAGSFVGICGHSGAGKTTMFKLIQRFYDPSHGVIKIGGKDIREIQPLWLRKQMAVAQQEPLILSDTMRANMVWGAEEQLELLAHSATSGDEAQIAEEELLMNAIRHVGREKPFLKSPEKFAQGLDTQIKCVLACVNVWVVPRCTSVTESVRSAFTYRDHCLLTLPRPSSLPSFLIVLACGACHPVRRRVSDSSEQCCAMRQSLCSMSQLRVSMLKRKAWCDVKCWRTERMDGL